MAEGPLTAYEKLANWFLWIIVPLGTLVALVLLVTHFVG